MACPDCNGTGKVEREQNVDGCDVPCIFDCELCEGTGMDEQERDDAAFQEYIDNRGPAVNLRVALYGRRGVR